MALLPSAYAATLTALLLGAPLLPGHQPAEDRPGDAAATSLLPLHQELAQQAGAGGEGAAAPEQQEGAAVQQQEAKQPDEEEKAQGEGARTKKKVSAVPDVEGSWAMLQITSAVADVPVVGDVITDTIAIGRVDIEQQGTKLVLREQTCDIRLRSSASKVRTVIPDAFVQAIPTLRTRARLIAPDSPGGPYGFERGANIVVLGAKLARPGRDKIPTDEDDARVFDHDGDGHPGVTVEIEGLISGKIYLVQRGWNVLRGELDASKGRITGRIRWSSEQNILDSTSMFLGSQPTTRPNPDAARSHFIARRLPKKASCRAILKSTQELFGS